jgi:hypothetical protein
MDIAPSVPASGKVRRYNLHRAASLEVAPGGKTFAAVRSRRRAWIVGVGGTSGDTVIFDTETRKVICGPILNSAKWNPILTAVGDRVYAMSSSPSWILDPDFPPWFEVLDLSKARVVTDVADRYHLDGCSWSVLPIPSCLPWELSPFEYHYKLPMVIVMSYVVVGPYILLSFNEAWGTHAFDTNSRVWHKVHDERLPFSGCATPQGSSIFLGLSKKDGHVNGYHIGVANSGKDSALKLSITMLPVRCKDHEVDAGPCFSSLDNGRFCSFRFLVDDSRMTPHQEYSVLFPRQARVNLTIHQIDNLPLLEASEETLRAGKSEITISSHWKQAFKITNSSHGFCPYSFTLLSL